MLVAPLWRLAVEEMGAGLVYFCVTVVAICGWHSFCEWLQPLPHSHANALAGGALVTPDYTFRGLWFSSSHPWGNLVPHFRRPFCRSGPLLLWQILPFLGWIKPTWQRSFSPLRVLWPQGIICCQSNCVIHMMQMSQMQFKRARL